ncbi:hypothetical protein QP185_03130 [Sphingomonas aerolata]|uniref:helix-hairpin-helix domain-containing protein n=1 Tax=Sphingomonas aerolata TaxID=185951 RepID=UPI002FE1306E
MTSGEWPDLVLIDGGKGRLNTVKAALEEIGVEDVCLVGIAEGATWPRRGARYSTCSTAANSSCPSARRSCSTSSGCADEVHRFAIGVHRDKRSEAIGASRSTKIPGIDPARKKALLMHFGTGRAVRNASLQDLQQAPAMSAAVAQQVYDFYHSR